MAQLTSAHPCFGGVQSFYSFESKETGLPMRFSVFMPPAVQPDSAMAGKVPLLVPLLVYLAGLTSTEETFAIKAGAQNMPHSKDLHCSASTPARAEPMFQVKPIAGTLALAQAFTLMQPKPHGQHTGGCKVAC